MDFGSLLKSLIGIPQQGGGSSGDEAPAFHPGVPLTLGNPGAPTPMNAPPAPTPGLGSALSGLFPVQAPQAPQGPAGDAIGQDVTVEHAPVFHSQVHGHNILGMIGDAFLAQAGRPLQYAPHVQQMQDAEALQNLTTNPDQAIRRLAQENPEMALRLYNSHSDDTRQQAIADAQIRAAQDTHEGIGRSRIGSLVSTMNAQNYDQVRQHVNTVAGQYGVDAPDLPSTYDEKAVNSALNAFVPVPTQDQLDSRELYRAQMMQYRRDSLQSREQIAAANRGAANSRASGAQAGADRRTRITTDAANGRSAAGVAETHYGHNLTYKVQAGRNTRGNVTIQRNAAGDVIGIIRH